MPPCAAKMKSTHGLRDLSPSNQRSGILPAVMDIKIPLAAMLLAGGAIGLMLPSGDDSAPAAGMAGAAGADDTQFTPDIQYGICRQMRGLASPGRVGILA